MSTLIIYQYPKCSTCRNAVKWLQAAGYELDLRHIVEAPPTEQELTQLVEHSGLDLKKFFNTSGEVYKELGLKHKLATLSELEQIALLSSHGKLIKRPIVTDGTRVTVGFKEDMFSEVWG
ncbi:arsenate reductase [Paenibacillus shirakamiensis]|uniref:Arsenate reductase n=1 Tax=Paenibacillus shirakamiensis TaxID=1265935 RepID=A0ABS4JFG2_9BACL|nr:arsenate reductase family protein [Paenibacillus shirakamiensis]MBP2000460.1 arsenate reductase [Paenibacillus shirakamiensis]